MRVLWVHNFEPSCAVAGVFMHRLYREMRAQGVDIALHYTGNLRGCLRIMRAAQRLRTISREYDLVHAQYGSACGLVASFAKTRKLVTFRGSDLLGDTMGGVWQLAHGLTCRLLSKMALPSYHNVVVVSHRLRKEVQQLSPNAVVEVVPSGINLQQFQPMDRGEARRRLGEGHNTAPWILFSSASPAAAKAGKRGWMAQAAFELLRTRCRRAELKFLTSEHPDRVPLWVNASNVILLTSTREGWPNIIKEGLACNIPFVSTDVSDLSIIANVAPNCFTTDATPQAIAESLLSALNCQVFYNLRQFVEPMEVGVIARRLTDLYQRICSQPL